MRNAFFWFIVSIALFLGGGEVRAELVFVGIAARNGDAALVERVRARAAELLDGSARNISSAREETTDDAAILEVTRRVQTARALFLEVDFDGALAELDEALVTFEDGPAFSTNSDAFDVLSEMLVLRAVILARLSRDLEMRATLARLVSALPNFRPNPAEVPPTIVREHSKLRKSRKQRYKIVVESSPPADVTLDGVPRGQTPITLDKLAPGFHYLSVRGEGEVFRQIVRLRRKPKKIEVSLGDPRLAAARVVTATLERGLEDEANLGRIIEPLGGDIVAGVLEGSSLILARVSGDKVRSAVEFPLVAANADLSLTNEGVAQVLGGGHVDEILLNRFLGRTPDFPPPPPDPEEGGLNPWLITGIVVGGVLIATGATVTVLALTAPPPEPGFRLTFELQ